MSFIANLRQHSLMGGAAPVAITRAQQFTRTDLQQQVQRLAAFFMARPEARIGLWLSSSYEFLCSFLALALAGKHIIMPHNMQAGMAAHMAHHFDGLITDKTDLAIACPCWHPGEIDDKKINVNRQISQREVALTLFTSGSTGEPQPIVKTLALLERELELLQQYFGAALGTHPVIATVSHQHIYGLLHAVLWPWLRGAAFVERPCQYPEVLAATAAELAPVILVSSPTHLSRLPQSPAFCAQAKSVAAVFSSGGLLEKNDAQSLAALLGRAPEEILGSTETGAVAWRCQSDTSLWQALPGVRVSRDVSGCLRVKSEHLGGANTFVMGDKVEFLKDGHFHLLGRADRVVKVEGKRLSLTEMERRLVEHPLVSEARLAVIRAKRDEVGAVVVLLESGQQQLAEQNKRTINTLLREHLNTFFERPLLPRRWRYLESLPRNTQGKLLAADITQLLQSRDM